MFDLDRCESERCAVAGAGATAQQAIREIVTEAVEAPQVLQALGEPRRVEVRPLYRHTLACIRP